MLWLFRFFCKFWCGIILGISFAIAMLGLFKSVNLSSISIYAVTAVSYIIYS